MPPRVLIASPVRQQPDILAAFLHGLEQLTYGDIEPTFMFADDNDDAGSSALLKQFANAHPSTVVLQLDDRPTAYARDARTHSWNGALIQRVATVKNFFFLHAVREKFDHVFLVDSDIVLHPRTLQHLLSLHVDVVSEVFWTKWKPDAPYLPQVWMQDQYSLHQQRPGERLAADEVATRQRDFLRRLRDGGKHAVGGLGACTLISTAPLARGLSFDPIPNVSFWGEDRAFCIRAAVMGVELWADTRYPPLHLYRTPELKRLPTFWRRAARRLDERPRVTLSMVVRNEADRYLRQALQMHATLVDEAVIIDDHSTDGTVALVEECLGGVPHHVYTSEASRFANEVTLRRSQWETTLRHEPDWILNLDADEMLEERARTAFRPLLARPGPQVVGFPLFDFWDDAHYREDAQWTAHHRAWPMLLRYTEEFDYKWKETALHCGRFPANVVELPSHRCDLRLKHFGWARPEDRRTKYARYRAIDPASRFGDELQMRSILDPSPRLVPWIE